MIPNDQFLKSECSGGFEGLLHYIFVE